MNILTVISNLNKGGTQRAGQNFAMGYKDLGHDSRILALYGLGYRYDEIKNIIPVFSGLDTNVLTTITNWKPDIIHIHSHGPKPNDVIKLIDFLKVKRISPKILEQNVFSNPTPWESKLLKSFQLSMWCQWLYEKRGGDHSKSTILPYAVMTDNFNPATKSEIVDFKDKYKIPENAFIFGRIGQSITTKWCKSIVEVFEDISKKHSNVYLLLIGCPPKIFKKFEHSAFKNNIINIDIILGDKNLSIAYSCMDVFYHAAEQGESFGHVIAESILCGTPVVSLSTPWGDNSQIEVVNNGVGGYVVHRPKSAVKVIDQIIKSDLKYNAKKGIEYIKREYDYKNVCDKAVKLSYDENSVEITSRTQLWDILNKTYDKPRRLDVLLLKLNLRQLIRITSGYNSIFTFFQKIINKLL
jgi:glycosyltransferase involved in cell wall biosynthesis